MKPEFWHERWRNNQIGFHQPEINAHLQGFWGELGVAGPEPIFVPLCGKSSDMLWLRSQGHRVLGVELSPIAVADFFSENRLEPRVTSEGKFQRWQSDGLTILCGDLFELEPAQLTGVSAAYDRASLIALPPGMRPAYVHHLAAILPQRAQLLLVSMEYPQQEMQGPPFAVTESEVNVLFHTHFQVQRLLTLEILDENPRFQRKGLSRLTEKVYRLIPAGSY